MPILSRETNLHPYELLESELAVNSDWWAMYTLPRQEKKLMRRLLDRDVPFYAPNVTHAFEYRKDKCGAMAFWIEYAAQAAKTAALETRENASA